MTSAVAILPARGGSKRIPRKNIRDFAGKPAIGWPIDAALASGVFAQVCVSTDDDEIAQVSRDLGAQTPFVRDARLADDFTGTTDVIRDAVRRLNLAPQTPVCCIYPTALFVRAQDLHQGLTLVEKGARWAMSVAQYPTPIDRAYRMEGTNLIPRDAAKMPMRSQDLEPAYFDVGQFYWAKAQTWLNPDAHVWDGAAAVEIPYERAIDIDTPDDWARAEMAFATLRSGEV